MRAWFVALTCVAALAVGIAATDADPALRAPARSGLRVCADPNNLPFSDAARAGFENRIAGVLADELGVGLEYTWWAQRRGFVRNTLRAGLCDVIIGAPAGWDPVLTTRPYYRSTYVFVTRADRGLDVRSFDDEALRRLRVGVQLIGNDGVNTPPVHALSRRGVTGNLVGYLVYDDHAHADPLARIVEAVARADVDVAIAWGPPAAYFAARQPVALRIVPVAPASESPGLRQVFAIAVGVRKDDRALRDALDAALERRRADVDRILTDYGVPRVDASTASQGTRP